MYIIPQLPVSEICCWNSISRQNLSMPGDDLLTPGAWTWSRIIMMRPSLHTHTRRVKQSYWLTICKQSQRQHAAQQVGWNSQQRPLKGTYIRESYMTYHDSWYSIFFIFLFSQRDSGYWKTLTSVLWTHQLKLGPLKTQYQGVIYVWHDKISMFGLCIFKGHAILKTIKGLKLWFN